MGLVVFKTTGVIKMTEDEEKAWQEDNKYFMDYDKNSYYIDAVVVVAIILVCAVMFVFELNQL